MKKYIVFVSLFTLLLAGQALAQELISEPLPSPLPADSSSDPANLPVSSDDPNQAVSSVWSTVDRTYWENLESGDPKILPSSPFYFFKEWTRGIQRAVTFNAVAKAELELRITNDKAVEARKVQNTQGQNENAVKKAVGNYQKAQEALKTRLESLKETSNNPNVGKLLDKVAGHVVKHEKLLDEITEKAQTEDVKSLVKKARERMEETTGAAITKDEIVKFTARLENALQGEAGGELKHIRSVEMLERIVDKAPESAKASLNRLKDDFSERAKESIEEMIVKRSPEALKEELKNLPGDAIQQSIILERIQDTVGDSAKGVLRETSVRLQEKVVKDGEGLAERAQEQIKRATELIQDLEAKKSENGIINARVGSLVREANEAFLGQQYGEALMQARSAEVIARNTLQKIEESRVPSAEDVKQHIEELAAKISRYEMILNSRTFVAIDEKAKILLQQAKEHIGYARDGLSKNDLVTAKTHIDHVKGYLNDLSRFIESSNKPSSSRGRSIESNTVDDSQLKTTR